MMKLIRWGLLAALCVMLGAVLVGHAHFAYAQGQGGSSQNPEKVQAARKRMEKGQALFSQGRYKEAMEEFEAAYAVQPFAAFLYNAAFAAEKSGDRQRAIARYNEFLAADPNSPYADDIRATVKRLEQELSAPPPPRPEPTGEGGAGGEGGGGEAGGEPAAPVPADEASIQQMRSLVIVESEPLGAPLTIYERVVATAAPFRYGEKNPGWRKVVADAKTPKDLSLKVGHYHVVIDDFQDYNRSETNLDLSPGHVYTYKASLSQGEFLGNLLIKTNVEKAKVYLDDPPPHKSAPWMRGTGNRKVNAGDHEVWVEAAGFEVFHAKVVVKQAETVRINADLQRVSYGYLVVDANAGEVEIEVDDRPYPIYKASGAPIKIKLNAGTHTLYLDASGRKTYEGEVTVPAGREQPVHGRLTESYPRGKAVAMGVLAVGLGVGGVFMHLEAEKPVGMPHNEDIHQVFNIGRYVAWGGAGLFAGLSIFYAVFDPNPDSLLKEDDQRDFPDDENRDAGPTNYDADKVKRETGGIIRPYLLPYGGPESGGFVVGGAF